MKNKFRNRYQIFNYIVSSERFKFLFLSTLMLSFYGAIGICNMNEPYIDTAISSYQFDTFNVLVFAILFFNTLNVCTTFDKEFSNYIIRLRNKKKYVIELVKTTIILNLFFFIIQFFIFFMILNLIKLDNIKIVNYLNYDVSNLIYLIFYLIRYVVYSIIITTLVTTIYINFKQKIAFVFCIIFVIGFKFGEFGLEIKDSLIIKPWYYYSTIICKSFSMELLFSIIYLIILLIIVSVSYFLTLKNKKWSVT